MIQQHYCWEKLDAGQFWGLTGFQVVFDFCVIQIEEATQKL